MRLRAAHIVLLLTLLALTGCGRGGRVIPQKKLMRMYTEMFLADQWVKDHPDAREAVDTTLFFDPLFRRHGYSFEDYDRTLHYYLDRPEKFGKMLNRAADQMRKEGAALQAVVDAEQERLDEIRHLLRLYRRQDFSTDSLRWSGPRTLWPVYVDIKDTVAKQDSAAVTDDAPQRPESLMGWDEIKPVTREDRSAPRRLRIEDREELSPDKLDKPQR